MMKSVLIAPCLALALGLIAPASTAATAQGSICQPAGRFAHGMYDEYGVRPHQEQGEAASFTCPLVRDTSSGDDINAVVLKVYDRHATLNVVCDLYLTDQDGTLLFSQRQQTSGADSAVKTLTWSGIAVSAYYGSLRCTIPGTAGTVAPYAGWASHLTNIYIQ